MTNGLFALLAFIAGFVFAQLSKCVIYTIQGKKQQKNANFGQIIRYLTQSGGMPSGHAASFVAATTYFGFTLGITSPIFALAVCMTLIVLYDAVNVRYAVGEQGKILSQIIKKEKYVMPKPQIIEGHTVAQIAVGILIGIVIGWLTFVIFGNF